MRINLFVAIAASGIAAAIDGIPLRRELTVFFSVENPLMVLPRFGPRLFFDSRRRSEALNFLSCADAIPASSNPLAAIATKRFILMFLLNAGDSSR